jgi:hypothetical protein
MELNQISIKDVSYDAIMKITARTLSVYVLLALAVSSFLTSTSLAASSSHHHRHAYTIAATIGAAPTRIASVHCVFGCPLGNNIMGVVVHQLINYFLWSYP